MTPNASFAVSLSGPSDAGDWEDQGLSLPHGGATSHAMSDSALFPVEEEEPAGPRAATAAPNVVSTTAACRHKQSRSVCGDAARSRGSATHEYCSAYYGASTSAAAQDPVVKQRIQSARAMSARVRSARPSRPPSARVSPWKNRILAFGTPVFICLIAGIGSGFSPLKEIMLDIGIFSRHCTTPWTSGTPCDAQLVYSDLTYTLAQALGAFLVVPIGFILDKWGPKILYILSCALLAMAFGLFSNAFGHTNHNFDDAVIPAFILLSTGGSAMYTASFHVANVYPAKSAFYVVLLNVSYDVSALMFSLLRMGFVAAPTLAMGQQTVTSFFYGYLLIVAAVLLFAVAFMPWRSVTAAQSLKVTPSDLPPPVSSKSARASTAVQNRILGADMADALDTFADPVDVWRQPAAAAGTATPPTESSTRSRRASRAPPSPSPLATNLDPVISQSTLKTSDVVTPVLATQPMTADPEQESNEGLESQEAVQRTKVPLKRRVDAGSSSTGTGSTTTPARAESAAQPGMRRGPSRPMTGRMLRRASGSTRTPSARTGTMRGMSTREPSVMFTAAVAGSVVLDFVTTNVVRRDSWDSMVASVAALRMSDGSDGRMSRATSFAPSAFLLKSAVLAASRPTDLNQVGVDSGGLTPGSDSRTRRVSIVTAGTQGPRIVSLDALADEIARNADLYLCLEHMTIIEQYRSPFYYLFVLHTATTVLFMNFYMQSINNQLLQFDMAKADYDAMILAWSIILPCCSVLVAPFLGSMLVRLPQHQLFFLVSAIAVLIGILVQVPLEPLQYVTMAVVAMLRPTVWTVACNYIGKIFGFGSFGRLYGSLLLVVGVTNFCAYGLNLMSLKLGNFWIANAILLVLQFVALVFPFVLLRWQRSLFERSASIDEYDAPDGGDDTWDDLAEDVSYT
ncbi:hypothetical protein AMAG_01882 [Allomyces macrogynus ATCC 38327]|uniref:Uncharacterized protein n=1 Tax=Allomyces macrogynus (strain ATCC 38327) TaxID=578462 RepID=A0A0L0S0H3_ALLM3|nr:hypothetical protein AMAG_01882 [Allomyces macrogynus ATCC 38327]|eukprot:KNE56038.1 hypothetical protein AMAG_01882 [Allomyces macrogynus ATCC 38327]